jgi:hypothetical protein
MRRARRPGFQKRLTAGPAGTRIEDCLGVELRAAVGTAWLARGFPAKKASHDHETEGQRGHRQQEPHVKEPREFRQLGGWIGQEMPNEHGSGNRDQGKAGEDQPQKKCRPDPSPPKVAQTRFGDRDPTMAAAVDSPVGLVEHDGPAASADRLGSEPHSAPRPRAQQEPGSESADNRGDREDEIQHGSHYTAGC